MQARITILAFVLLSAGATNASADAPIGGAILSKKGALSPLRPEAVPEAERELKLGATAGRTALHITLPPASRPERATQAPGRGPVAVAFHREMPERFRGDLSSRLEWTPLDDGAIAAAVSVTSPGATDMRMGVLVDLAPGGELRFFGTGAGERFPVITRSDLAWKGDRPQTLWSPVVEGDTIGVEITLPSRAARSAFSFRVDRISHGHEAERAPESGYRSGALFCPNHLDYQCAVDRRRVPKERGDSTALLRYEKSGAGYACSGVLLSDRADTFTPYLLTANHCISTPDVADSVSAQWFYQRSACGGGGIDSRYATTSGGAEVLATSVPQDSTLLRLKRSPPGGLLHAGWSSRPIIHSTGVFGIHHPDGGVKKYSAGRTTRFLDFTGCDDPVRGIGCADRARGIEVDWSEGTTEHGSSGSGLFLTAGSEQYLIGVKSAFTATSCQDRVTLYGNFSDFYPRIRRWLDPGARPPSLPPDDHGNTEADATHVSIPSTTRGSVERGGDVDWFRLNLGEHLGVGERGELRVETTGGTDTYGTLFRLGGRSLIAGDDDSGDGHNFRIVADVRPETLHVEVRGHDGNTTGDYSLKVALSAPSPEPPQHTLPLLTPASNTRQQGLVRIVNWSPRAGEVRIDAIDDAGRRFGPVTLSLDAGEATGFSSRDLERGNPSKGLSGGVGDGEGYWWLEFRTELDVEVRAYLRSADGFLASMHQRAAVADPVRVNDYYIPFFNPGSNLSFRSVLRVINPGPGAVDITISAWDARGNAAPGGDVIVPDLAHGAARMLTAQQLERGGAGLSGRLGDGQGKWRLLVSASHAIQVMSLVRSRSGNLSNLSR